MTLRIGIPQCSFFYYDFPWWKTFFHALGTEVVTSGFTDRWAVEQGLKLALDELCFPMKLHHGHIQKLAQMGVDYLFLPRLVSVERDCFICPNFMGLPDMIRSRIKDLPPLLTPHIDLRQGEALLWRQLKALGAELGQRPGRVKAAQAAAEQEQHRYRRLLEQGYAPPEAIDIWQGRAVISEPAGDLLIGVLGHVYALYDPRLSLGLLETLKSLGCRVQGMEAIAEERVEDLIAGLPRRIFWTTGKRMLAAAMAMEADPSVDGVVCLSSMNCGPDSILLDLVQAQLRQTPRMLLSVDEHSAEVGILTRLEAFCDMLRRGRRHRAAGAENAIQAPTRDHTEEMRA